MFSEYIEDYFNNLDGEIHTQVNDKYTDLESKVDEMDSMLTLLEQTMDQQHSELTQFVENFDNGFEQVLEVSKQSVSESKMLQVKLII